MPGIGCFEKFYIVPKGYPQIQIFGTLDLRDFGFYENPDFAGEVVSWAAGNMASK